MTCGRLAIVIGMLVIAALAGCVTRETAAVIADKETGIAFDCRLAAEEIADELDASPVRFKESQADYGRRLAPCRGLDIPPGSYLAQLIQLIEQAEPSTPAALGRPS